MKGSKRNIIAVILVLITAFVTCFILFNSFLNFSSSHRLSGAVMKWLFGAKTNQNGLTNDYCLRKAAHIIEYAALGCAAMGLTIFCRRQFNKNIVWFSCIGVALIAIIDEVVQSFSNRTSSGLDVLLDLCGVIIGFGLILAVTSVLKTLKNSAKNRKGK